MSNNAHLNENNFFLLTQKIYEPLNDPDFEKKLKAHFGKSYPGKSTNKKWEVIEEIFVKNKLIQNPELFKKFIEKRKNTLANINTISKENFLLYMEKFYFILTTKEEFYQLSESQKKSAIADINKNIFNNPVCDPGLETNCNEFLSTYLRTSNWLINALHQQRKTILMHMAAAYNASHAIGANYETHTGKIINELAEKIDFGLSLTTKINDPYYSKEQKDSIKNFFFENINKYLQQYENDLIENLNQYLFTEFNIRADEKDQKINKFCRTFFSSEHIHKFYIINDETDDVDGEVNPEAAKGIIKDLLKQKLLREDYLLCPYLDNLDKIIVKDFNPKITKLLTEFVRVAFSDSIENKNSKLKKLIIDLLAINNNIIIDRQKLFDEILKNHPSLYDVLPNAISKFQNTHNLKMINSEVSHINTLLASHDNHHPSELLNLTITGVSNVALQKFHQALRNNINCNYATWQRNKNFLEFQNHLRLNARNNNAKKSKNIYSQKYLQQQAELAVLNNNNWVEAFLDFQKSIPLFNEKFAPHFNVKNQLQSSLLFLKKFMNAIWNIILNSFFIYLLFLGYKAYIITDLILKILFTNFILLNPLNFQIMLLLSLCLILKQIFIDRIFSTGEFLDIIFLISHIYTFIFSSVVPFDYLYMASSIFLIEILSLLISAISHLINKPYSYHDVKQVLSHLIIDILTLDAALILQAIEPILKIIANVFLFMPMYLDAAIRPWISRPFHTLSAWLNSNENQPIQKIVADLENNIMRLDNIKDISAHEKSFILKKLWLFVQNDFMTQPEELRTPEKLIALLNKKYEITHKDQDLSVSFNTVAATNRTKGKEFIIKVNIDPANLSFFKRPTSLNQNNLSVAHLVA